MKKLISLIIAVVFTLNSVDTGIALSAPKAHPSLTETINALRPMATLGSPAAKVAFYATFSPRQKEIRIKKLCDRAESLLWTKRYDPRTKQYVSRYDEASLLLVEALYVRGFSPGEIAYFRQQLEKSIEIIIEDPGEAWGILMKDPKIERIGFCKPAELLLEIKRKEAVLKRLQEERFGKDRYIDKMVVPDGKGGYFIDKVGTPGRWEASLVVYEAKAISSASITRFADSLCDIIYNDHLKQNFGVLQERLPKRKSARDVFKFGKIMVVGSFKRAVTPWGKSTFYRSPRFPGILVESNEDNELRLYVTPKLLRLSRRKLRRYLRHAFDALEVSDIDVKRERIRPSSKKKIRRDRGLPKVVMLDFSELLGPHLLKYSLEMNGISAQVTDSLKDVMFEKPNIFCISLTNDKIEEASEAIKKIRRKYPDAFIIVGGPSAMKPKSLIALLPEIDILIRGEGEEVLPRVVKIIGRAKRRAGLSTEQIAALEQEDGLFLRTPGLVILNNLNRVNMVKDFDVPVMHDAIAVTNSTWNITRGCPYKCKFCTMAMGRKYRHPHINKLKHHIIGTLALHTPLPPEVLGKLMKLLNIREVCHYPSGLVGYLPLDIHRFSKKRAGQILSLLYEGLLLKEGISFSQDVLEDIAQAFGPQLKPKKGLAPFEALIDSLPGMLTRTQIQYLILAIKKEWVKGLLKRGENLHNYGLCQPSLPCAQDTFSGHFAEGLQPEIRFPMPKKLSEAIQSMLQFDDDQMEEFLKLNSPHNIHIDMVNHLINIPVNKQDFLTLLKTMFTRLMKKEHIDPSIQKAILLTLLITVKNLITGVDSERSYMDEATEDRVWMATKEIWMATKQVGETPGENYLQFLPDRINGVCAANMILALKSEIIRGRMLSDRYRYFVPLKITKSPPSDIVLVDKNFFSKFCSWIIENGLDSYFVFTAGQNSISTLLSNGGGPDEKFIQLLSRAGFKSISLGTDGLTDAILEQNEKNSYTLEQAIKVNKALVKHGFYAENNHIYSTPYASDLDVIESILISVLIPFKLREYGIPYIFSVLGSQFTNEYIVNHPGLFIYMNPVDKGFGPHGKFGVGGMSTIVLGHKYSYVPAEFPEYQMLGDKPLYPTSSPANAITRELEIYFIHTPKDERLDKVPGFIQENCDIDKIEEIVKKWQSLSPKDYPELRALGELVKIYNRGDIFDAFRRIRSDIQQKNRRGGRPHLFTFTDLLRLKRKRASRAPAGSHLRILKKVAASA